VIRLHRSAPDRAVVGSVRGRQAKDMTTSIGLVLGAGGVVGQAYHAGTLAALEETHGWDPRSASVIVGTSAGSITGTLLRLGISASDLAANATGVPMTSEGAELFARIVPDGGTPLPHPEAWELLRPWRPPSIALVTRFMRRPWAFRPEVALMTLLPRGLIDIVDRAGQLDALVGTAWPEELWICAARRDDGARVVFGRPGAPPATLAAAVLASCAIPAYFAPITIDGTEYFDGGVHSPTNADVLRKARLDAVVVVSPMSADLGLVRGPDAMVRWAAHRRLLREVGKLEAAGTTVVRIEPGRSARAAMGLWAMTENRSDRVVRAAFAEASKIPLPVPFLSGQPLR
jgi:NTE family protein